MHRDLLFLETVRELRSRGARPSEYDVVSIAGLLRKLLLDSPTLVDVVNKERRLDITYVVNAREPDWKLFGEIPLAYAIEDGFDPRTAIAAVQPLPVRRSQLLSRGVLAYRGHELTVRDLISYTANTAGGVHFDPPRNEREAAVQAVATFMRVGQYPAGGKTLLAVGRVVAKGLQPLVARIELDLAA